VLKFLSRLLSRDFHKHRPVGMKFWSTTDFFWHEVGYSTPKRLHPKQPTLALIIQDVPGGLKGSGLDFGGPEPSQHFLVRLAVDSGMLEAQAWVVHADPPLELGDLCIFYPMFKHPITDVWMGPLIAQLAPTYSEQGYVTMRQLMASPVMV
jgi:hypothetical protein